MKRFITLAAALLCAYPAKVPKADGQEATGATAHGSVVGARRLNSFILQSVEEEAPTCVS